MQPRAVIFDAFGTLLRIGKGRHPYKQLIQLGVAQGRNPRPDDAWLLMSQPLDLAAAAARLGIEVSAQTLARLEQELRAELDDIEPFPDALEALALLKERGIRLALCSNLALPYAEAVRRWFPALDAYVFSFEVGAIKPQPVIYQRACELLATEPAATAMVGDSMQCDCEGPQAIGVQGYFLNRSGGVGGHPNLLAFAKAVLSHQ